MSDIVQAPTFPPAEIDRLRGESLVALQQQGDDPVATAPRWCRASCTEQAIRTATPARRSPRH